MNDVTKKIEDLKKMIEDVIIEIDRQKNVVRKTEKYLAQRKKFYIEIDFVNDDDLIRHLKVIEALEDTLKTQTEQYMSLSGFKTRAKSDLESLELSQAEQQKTEGE